MSRRVALIQVLGAVAYGELKAYEGLRAEAKETGDPDERRLLRTFAAQELRHHKGFVSRLEALGADPERAMRPYRAPLDHYHGGVASGPVEEAVRSYLGEGIADDLLRWLRTVVDPETATFIDGVLQDEEQHEGHATEELRALLAAHGGRQDAARAANRMLAHMALSGRRGAAPLLAFLQLGRTSELLARLIGGFARRLRAIGVNPATAALAGVTL